MPSVSAHVALTLARHIDHVFGVMGNGNAHFLDALERSTEVTYTAMRHEAGGVVAADAHHFRTDTHKGEDVTMSTLVAFTTITTTLPSRDEDRPRLLRNVAERDQLVTVVDTLTKDAD